MEGVDFNAMYLAFRGRHKVLLEIVPINVNLIPESEKETVLTDPRFVRAFDRLADKDYHLVASELNETIRLIREEIAEAKALILKTGT